LVLCSFKKNNPFNQKKCYISLKIIMKDESLLFSREYLDEYERNHSFHWQDKNDRFIIRWDNARHHKDIRTYPHHKHTGETVTESFEISLPGHDFLNKCE